MIRTSGKPMLGTDIGGTEILVFWQAPPPGETDNWT